jgi:diamine N-acetyltransferase
MPPLHIQAVTDKNWRRTLELAVLPEQQPFVAGFTPIAAIALAKAYIRPGGLTWDPYALLVESTMVGFIALAYLPGSAEQYSIYHFFIDYRHQGKGYGRRALLSFVPFVAQHYPACRMLQLTVHPDNTRARALYASLGFQPTGRVVDGEPLYQLPMP